MNIEIHNVTINVYGDTPTVAEHANVVPEQQSNSSETPNSSIKPRPEGCCGKCPETADRGYDCTCEDNPRCSKNNPRPEDVPPNEPWLIEADGQKAIGTRYKGDAYAPWAVAALNGSFVEDYPDYEITLIHKLVAEPPALPKGMRLADHARYGRVVVSPKTDEYGEHRIFCSSDDTESLTGSDWGFVRESKLTFLDRNQ